MQEPNELEQLLMELEGDPLQLETTVEEEEAMLSSPAEIISETVRVNRDGWEEPPPKNNKTIVRESIRAEIKPPVAPPQLTAEVEHDNKPSIMGERQPYCSKTTRKRIAQGLGSANNTSCKVCQLTFKHRRRLRAHVPQHFVRLFCNCGYASSSRDVMVKHQRFASRKQPSKHDTFETVDEQKYEKFCRHKNIQPRPWRECEPTLKPTTSTNSRDRSSLDRTAAKLGKARLSLVRTVDATGAITVREETIPDAKTNRTNRGVTLSRQQLGDIRATLGQIRTETQKHQQIGETLEKLQRTLQRQLMRVHKEE